MTNTLTTPSDLINHYNLGSHFQVVSKYFKELSLRRGVFKVLSRATWLQRTKLYDVYFCGDPMAPIEHTGTTPS